MKASESVGIKTFPVDGTKQPRHPQLSIAVDHQFKKNRLGCANKANLALRQAGLHQLQLRHHCNTSRHWEVREGSCSAPPQGSFAQVFAEAICSRRLRSEQVKCTLLLPHRASTTGPAAGKPGTGIWLDLCFRRERLNARVYSARRM